MVPSSHQLSLKLIERCPSCQLVVPEKHIHILSETDTNLLAHLSCPYCFNKFITYIVNHPQGLIGNAILTDLTYDETRHMMRQQPLDENTFLSLYTLVRHPQYLASLKLQHLNRNQKHHE